MTVAQISNVIDLCTEALRAVLNDNKNAASNASGAAHRLIGEINSFIKDAA